VSVDALERRQFLSAAPSLDLLADEFIPVGRSVTIRGLVADADSSSLTVTVDFGDGTTPAARLVNTASNPLFSVTHAYATRATFPLTVTVDDGDGGVTTQSSSVTGTDMAGAVFEDADDNGLRDFHEAPVAGATVFLDADANGRADPGEATAATDAAGFYHFDGLAPGAYKVGYVAPAGWRVTNPDPVPASTTTVGEGFGGQRSFGISRRARVGGSVFVDFDGNGVRDGADFLTTDYTPYIDVNDDGFFDSAVDRRADTRVGAGQTYFFRNLEAGTYIVRLGPAAPGHAEAPGPQAISGLAAISLPGGGGNAAYVITVGPADSLTRDFGVTPARRHGRRARLQRRQPERAARPGGGPDPAAGGVHRRRQRRRSRCQRAARVERDHADVERERRVVPVRHPRRHGYGAPGVAGEVGAEPARRRGGALRHRRRGAGDAGARRLRQLRRPRGRRDARLLQGQRFRRGGRQYFEPQ
jgi:hypothetical protein